MATTFELFCQEPSRGYLGYRRWMNNRPIGCQCRRFDKGDEDFLVGFVWRKWPDAVINA